MLLLKDFKTNILSKNLVVLYLNFLADSWEEDIAYQYHYKLMWLNNKKRRYKKFVTFLFYQFLNNKRSPLLTLKLNRIFYQTISDSIEKQKLYQFCIKEGIFKNLLTKNAEYINLVILIIGLNLLFFNILPFSEIKFKELKKRRFFYLQILCDYMSLKKLEQYKKYPDLFLDIQRLKIHTVSNAHKKYLKINQLVFKQIFYNIVFLLPKTKVKDIETIPAKNKDSFRYTHNFFASDIEDEETEIDKEETEDDEYEY